MNKNQDYLNNLNQIN